MAEEARPGTTERRADALAAFRGRRALILWLGAAFDDESLLADLPRLPVVAVFQESQKRRIEEALAERALPPFAVPITTREEADAWTGGTLPVFYLGGLHGDATQGRRADARRSAMLMDCLPRICEDERPLIVALGLRDEAEIDCLLESVAEHDPRLPVLAVADEAGGAAFERAAARARPSLLTFVQIDGAWPNLREVLRQLGVPLAVDELEVPAVQVGHVRVPLDRILGDPGLDIEESWRLITIQAFAWRREKASLDELFEALIDRDERRDAQKIANDLREWWAISENLAYHRVPFHSERERLLAALRELETSDYHQARIHWIAAEPGSGCTLFLHLLAHEAARAGYPTVVAKQMAQNPLGRRIRDFLTLLDRNARELASPEDGRAKLGSLPILMVLDTDHWQDPEWQRLPDYLVRVSGRPVLTVWGVPLPDGYASDRRDISIRDLRRVLVRDQEHFPPRTPDERLDRGRAALLRTVASTEEIVAVQAHAEKLYGRGISIQPRVQVEWQQFLQTEEDRYLRFVERSRLLSEDELQSARAAFRPEALFWVLLHFFLRAGEQSGLASGVRQRLDRILGSPDNGLGHERLALLAELAKTSVWGFPLPQTALVDRIEARRAFRGPQPVSSLPEPSAQPLTSDELRELLRIGTANSAKLSDLQSRSRGHKSTSGDAPPRLAGASSLVDVHLCLDDLSERGWARTVSLQGRVWGRLRNRTLARFVARELAERETVPNDIRAGIDERALWDIDRAPALLIDLIASLRASADNITLCEALSEHLLQGRRESSMWRGDVSELHLQAYEAMSESIRRQSRVLLHHYAVVLRRTTFDPTLEQATRRERLLQARNQLLQALELPWRRGVRDEHPGFIRTTLALVLESLAKDEEAEADAVKHLDGARDALREALREVPGSRHTRFALARLLLDQLRSWLDRSDRADEERDLGAERSAVPARIATEILQLLAVEPTARHEEWEGMKLAVRRMFDRDKGRAYLDSLCRERPEDGWLLRAEMLIAEDPSDQDRVGKALDWLLPLVESEQGAATNRRAARRAAALMAEHRASWIRFEERYRLLRVVEEEFRTTPVEEFHLACLAYQLGRYMEGRDRFASLRATGRHRDVADEQRPYLVDARTGEPIRFTGLVLKIESGRGRMEIRVPQGRGFDAEFLPQQFEAMRPRMQRPVLVQLFGKGPHAVPIWRAGRSGGR